MQIIITHVCARACVRACVRASVRACVRAGSLAVVALLQGIHHSNNNLTHQVAPGVLRGGNGCRAGSSGRNCCYLGQLRRRHRRELPRARQQTCWAHWLSCCKCSSRSSPGIIKLTQTHTYTATRNTVCAGLGV